MMIKPRSNARATSKANTAKSDHGAGVHGLRRRHRHGHAKRLEAVESGLGHGNSSRKSDIAGGRSAVCNRVERGRDIARFRGGRRLLKRAELILARVFFLILTGQVEVS